MDGGVRPNPFASSPAIGLGRCIRPPYRLITRTLLRISRKDTEPQGETSSPLGYRKEDLGGSDPVTAVSREGEAIATKRAVVSHASTIENGAFIGMRATVMDRAVVESGAMVAGGSVVTPGKVVKSGQLWAGYPARYMRDLTAAERDNIPYTAEHYRELGVRYLSGSA